MNILFVHQNFPGQYLHIVQRLAKIGGHQLVALGINPLDKSRELSSRLKYFQYSLGRGNANKVTTLVMVKETKVIRE